MKNTKITSITAVLVIATMVAACATPNGLGSISQADPCQPSAAQSSFSPASSFMQQVILNPLMNIGGTLLATAAQNYSAKYTGKLNKFLTKLMTPKKKKRKAPQQPVDQGFPFENQDGQPDLGFGDQVDPNTGFPGQEESDFPGQDDFGQTQEQIDPNTGFPVDLDFVEEGQFQQEFPQEDEPIEPGFEGQGEFNQNLQGNVQPRGVRQRPQISFPSNPCEHQQTVQQYPPADQQNQPYENEPKYQSQEDVPYSQQQGQHPYESTDPYAQQSYPQDPYDQQEYPQDPYGQQPPQQDPYAPQGYPQEPYAQQGYPQDPNALTGYPGEGEAVGAPIGLDVVMLKKTIRNGASVMLPVNDGDVLKDGRGNVQAGDKFRIMFRPHTDGYVYVVAIDGSGWAQGIFPPPTSPLANPVKTGQQYVLPEGNNWFSLDQFKGIETIFFVASQEKRQDLEETLQSITGHERPATATPQQVTKVAMVPYGVGSAHPSAQGFYVSTGSGQNQTIMPTSYFAKTAGEDLRLTRWFRHE